MRCVLLSYVVINKWGTLLRSWSRHSATSRKIAGSIAGGVTGVFYWFNLSNRTMALESVQPLTEMNTGSIPWSVTPGAWNLSRDFFFFIINKWHQTMMTYYRRSSEVYVCMYVCMYMTHFWLYWINNSRMETTRNDIRGGKNWARVLEIPT